jgi:hypothetical protein
MPAIKKKSTPSTVIGGTELGTKLIAIRNAPPNQNTAKAVRYVEIEICFLGMILFLNKRF